MAGRRSHLRASLLDRPVGPAPGGPSAPGPRRAHSTSELHEAVGRDLERLLSTRRGRLHEKDQRLVHDYGVPDFQHLSPRSDEDRAEMAAAIREAVELYEPRLTQVRVRVEGFTEEELREHPERLEAVRIRIEGMLQAEGVQEPVSFPFVVRR